MDSSFSYTLSTKSDISNLAVVCLADTHSQRVVIPPGDILIHAGDLSKNGKPSEIQNSLSWIASQPHTCKIVIGGNADLALDKRCVDTSTHHFNWHDIIYLCESAASIILTDIKGNSRSINVYGSPFVLRCGPDGEEAFQYDVDVDYWRDTIPLNTHILVSHTPPKFILDEWAGSSEGCTSLWEEVQRVRPNLHVFGHVHPGSGQLVVNWSKTPHKDSEDTQESTNTQEQFQFMGRNIFSEESLTTTFVNAACSSADGSTMANTPRVVYI